MRKPPGESPSSAAPSAPIAALKAAGIPFIGFLSKSKEHAPLTLKPAFPPLTKRQRQ
jgi:hypothetical protein